MEQLGLVELQWGHTQTGVEARRCEHQGLQRIRFNGATPKRAWKRPHRLRVSRSHDRLQWGHTQTGVEAPWVSIWTLTESSLQWGHTQTGVEARGQRLVGRDRLRFNGATPKRAWKHGARRSSDYCGLASMGPHPNGRGSANDVERLEVMKEELQWGHTQTGVEAAHGGSWENRVGRFAGCERWWARRWRRVGRRTGCGQRASHFDDFMPSSGSWRR